MPSNSLPQARVFRKAGRLMTAPPIPRGVGPTLGEQLRAAAVYAIGLWPLTCVVLLLCGLLIMAGNNGAP
jgi:hypothetical protein